MNTKLENKNKLLKHCLEILKERAGNAKMAMDDLQKSANEYGLPKDRYDSYRTQLLRKRDLHAEQLQKAMDEIKLLEKIDINKEYQEVKFGSLVETNKQKLFISVSLGKVFLEKTEYYAISAKVPIYSKMQGLKKGDQFSFNSNTFKIIDVY